MSSKLRILNGRKTGDSIGYFTCHKYNGSSVVNYCLVGECIFKDIIYFHVQQNLSDLSVVLDLACRPVCKMVLGEFLT